jgi:plastocyanin
MQATNLASRNVHQLIPNEVTIRAGGTVNFVIAGFHQIVIYDNGTQPDNIDTNLVLPAPVQLLIDDPRGRIYRGLAPAMVPANFFGPGVPPADIARPPGDRVESVNFPNPGVYLVICSVLPHFEDGMFGYVTVVP